MAWWLHLGMHETPRMKTAAANRRQPSGWRIVDAAPVSGDRHATRAA
jgi:hypothetical protein